MYFIVGGIIAVQGRLGGHDSVYFFSLSSIWTLRYYNVYYHSYFRCHHRKLVHYRRVSCESQVVTPPSQETIGWKVRLSIENIRIPIPSVTAVPSRGNDLRIKDDKGDGNFRLMQLHAELVRKRR